MGATDYLENKIMDHIFGMGNRNYIPATSLYLGFSKSQVMDDESGVDEPSGSGYSRKLISFNAASDGVASNSNSISWSATGKWGQIKYAFISDGTHILIYDSGFDFITRSGVTVSIPSGSLNVSIKGSVFSDYMKNKILDHILGGGQRNYTPPSAIYLSLWKKSPYGNFDFELSGGGYSRVATSSSDWSQASDGVVKNISPIQFPTANQKWGGITSVGFHDASVGGNLLIKIKLETEISIKAGSALKFNAGDISVGIK